MFSQHDPSVGNEQPSWPAPAGSPPVVDNDPPTREPERVRSGRCRWALAAVAVLTIAGGTVGGALAGKDSKATVTSAASSSTSSTSTGGFNNASVAPSSPDKVDVSALISKALPGVVSISVQLNGSPAAGTGFVISSDGQIATNAHVVADATKIEVKFSDEIGRASCRERV